MAVNASEKLLAEPDRVRRIGDIHESMRNADAAHEARRTRAPSANWRISMCPTIVTVHFRGGNRCLARQSPARFVTVTIRASYGPLLGKGDRRNVRRQLDPRNISG